MDSSTFKQVRNYIGTRKLISKSSGSSGRWHRWIFKPKYGYMYQNNSIRSTESKASLTVSLLIVFCACVIAWALRISYLTHLNEAKLSKILSTLAMKFPDLDMELKTISTHQEIVVAPIYYLAKLVSIFFGPLSSGLIILLDRAMKMLFSLGTISGIAYLILQHSNSNRVGESKVAADDIFTRNEAGPDDALFGS